MTVMNSSVSKDLAGKQIFSDPALFADLFNGTLFYGNEVIKKEELQEAENEVSSSIELDEMTIEFKRFRDIVRKTGSNADYVLLALENQSSVDYTMPLRVRVYDDCSFLKQLNTFSVKNAEKKKMKKRKRLKPIFTIVLYYGEKKWDGPVKLSEMMDIPDEYLDLFQDFEIKIVDMSVKEERAFKEKMLSELFDLVHIIYRKEKEEFQEELMKNDYSAESFKMAIQMTGALELVEMIEKKEENQMCQNVKRWIAEYKQEGLEEGMLNEKKATIHRMMKKGFSTEIIAECVRLKTEEVNAILNAKG